MPTKITKLTPDQEARMGSFAQEWIQRGWRTTPLTEEEWAVWESGARRCYEHAGIPFPSTIVRVPSPLVGAYAAPIAAYLIANTKRDAVRGAVDGAVGGAVHGAVRDAVDGAVRGAVGDAVRGAVDGAVHGAVHGAVRQTIRQLWYYRLGGIHWAAWWQSYIAYFRDVAELQLPGDLWDRSRAYEDAMSAGWWWPFRDFIMVCDVPHTLHLEQVAPTGWGSHRLHCETGPAVAWDGFPLYFWHGVRVPADLIEDGWTTDRILQESNAEVRRCAIERLGWDQFIVDAELTQVGAPVDDPGNPGHVLALYDVPRRIYDADVRVLLCTNATEERDGTRRRFGLTVPASINDPVAAAAWTFGLNPSDYRQMERAS